VSLVRLLGVALTALSRAKMRAFLTVLGVIIGVGAVIAMVSVGEGAKAKVAQTFAAMGTNTLVVSSGSSSSGGARGGAGTAPTLTWRDLEAIGQLDTIGFAAPQIRKNLQAQSTQNNVQTQVTGTSPEFFDIRSWPMEAGDPLSAADVTGQRKVAVLGKTVVANLFPDGSDPIGQTVMLDRTPFRVIGVAVAKGTAANGSDNDDMILVPSTTFATKIGAGNVAKYLPGQILVAAAAGQPTANAQAEIEELLRRNHKLRDGAEDDFTVRDLSAIAAAQAESTDTITSLLAGVALVSLIVGGIGIMNIMLVSVTERTREIGLRMALGAKARHVLYQFLIEATVLSVAGGIVGIVAGFAAARGMAAHFGFPWLVSPSVVVLAVGVSGLVGIGFGLYPARKASRLDPITALRHE
jgi:putative ABC transport system permease protein